MTDLGLTFTFPSLLLSILIFNFQFSTFKIPSINSIQSIISIPSINFQFSIFITPPLSNLSYLSNLSFFTFFLKSECVNL